MARDDRGVIDVLFLLLPGSLLLDWAGPAEALRMANAQRAAQGEPPRFRLRFAGPGDGVAGSVGPLLTGLEPLPATLPTPSWVVLVGQPGDAMDLRTPPARAALHWLRGLRLAAGQLELVCVCAGAVIAARAGLLAGRQATTHHQHLDELRAAEPACEVLANRVFVQDGPVWSSAGVTCGIDLALHRIAAACGAPLAARVAQSLVVALRRGPHDAELSPFLRHRDHLHPAVHRVQDALSQAPRQDWPLAAMAQVAHTSPRHLTRLFAEHAGTSPQDYLRTLRLAVAQAGLQAGRSVTQAADLAGFSSDTQLRRAWHRAGLARSPAAARGLNAAND
ncbi:GlxA family transcriptional regulator [Ottowia testudinis]|uniref:Helix-turn-helix domain-containing protein n=1 Tax=Ottowia testudinis TaxID=2816950 RepID=A0A975CL30_9BURK|nr:helix-turn-helix domain-containing protein [Ottowia testudinis]QTD47051.1 helix-turn-helix domain-containing protein [Ottowia testudinis]